MTSEERLWIKVEAAYRAGKSLSAICKEFGVKMRALLERIKAGQWTRAADDARKPEPPPASLPTTVGAISAEIKVAIQEAVTDIIKGHKSISRQLREHFEHELAEYQGMVAMFATFLDENHIKYLQSLVQPGEDNPALKEYLYRALDAFYERTKNFEKLVRIGAVVIDKERAVWGLDRDDADGDEKAKSYDDLLDEIKGNPLPASQLPSKVIDFERRMAQRGSK